MTAPPLSAIRALRLLWQALRNIADDAALHGTERDNLVNDIEVTARTALSAVPRQRITLHADAERIVRQELRAIVRLANRKYDSNDAEYDALLECGAAADFALDVLIKAERGTS